MLTSRVALEDDLPALKALMDRAIGELQRGFLNDAEIAASHAIMGLDTQLIVDRTYFRVESDGASWLAAAAGLGAPPSTGATTARPCASKALLDLRPTTRPG